MAARTIWPSLVRCDMTPDVSVCACVRACKRSDRGGRGYRYGRRVCLGQLRCTRRERCVLWQRVHVRRRRREISWGCAERQEGQLGHGDGVDQPVPRLIKSFVLLKALHGVRVVAVACGHAHSVATTGTSDASDAMLEIKGVCTASNDAEVSRAR